MFPISDDNPEPGTPFVTWGLIAICCAVFFLHASLPPGEAELAVYQYGLIPGVLFGSTVMMDAPVPAWATIFSSMFMHGGLAHLAGNMLYLWIFGDNIELAMGRLRFILFYLLTGAAAALAHAFLVPASTVPLVGASGAISGVLGAYLLLYPHGRVQVLLLPFPIILLRTFYVPAIVVLGLWFLIQVVSGLMSPAEEAGVAFWAHVGGFVAGMVLVPFFKRRDVPLFHPAQPRVFDARSRARRGPWG
ncbi:rhomboid family intramembrane serine protease [Parvibaculum sp.]|uniref:rhomboid family intramembrane serine protease n=1 Tax=Parvibaculum sp. TaxID=2024848 RepID=UPI000C519CA5|nr:rhomboid family intramembrane serine protease [Parvibaculum sp.]MAM94888.1 rhomboid family intramembrane serine protease [Parvibaculum sp.]HCX68885.1 rhomboid family intramembrane serine protease [Rhodobiaceae bacterium]|tara:strand:+ start:17517 stop:18257 length:741 start_codon:yes stop_codon:yes gene_type:complete